MTGAGGLKMANYLYELAPRDGTYFGVIGNYLPALQAAGGRGPQFDAGRFNWLGSLTRESQTMAVWHTTGVKSVADATRREIVAGASARGAITYSFPAMMNTFFGTRFRIVTGYSGGNDINLAMERGEVEARTNSWQSWKVNRAHWLRDGKIAIIAYGGHRTSELSHVPMVEDIARNEEDRQVLRLLTLGADARPAVRGAAGGAGGAGRGAACGVRGDHARSGSAGRDRSVRDGARSARRGGDPQADRKCAKFTQNDRRAGEGISAIGPMEEDDGQ